jgi:hypothetical protein
MAGWGGGAAPLDWPVVVVRVRIVSRGTEILKLPPDTLTSCIRTRLWLELLIHSASDVMGASGPARVNESVSAVVGGTLHRRHAPSSFSMTSVMSP